jgi:hypothetical protein
MQTVIALVDISSRTRSDRYHVVEKPYQSKGYGYLHKYAGSNPLYTNVSKFSHFAVVTPTNVVNNCISC